MSEQSPFGLTLLVNKPLEWTSFDVVNKLRYACKSVTGRKKIKVGHAGTLDPLATGLVIICIGSHTKQINDFMGLDKAYEGTLKLGATTPSLDLETDEDQHFPIPENDAERLQQTADSFIGQIEQVPPIFSAKKINGQKAYDLARKGKTVELKPNIVRIDSFNVESNNFPNIDFKVKCSKGTYIRSLARDYGLAMQSGAYLTRLIRTDIGPYKLSDANTIEAAIELIQSEFLKYSEVNSF